MSLLNKLEKRFGRYAIPNLITLIIGGQALVFLMARTPEGAGIIAQLAFSARLIAQGQIWRVLTFVFIPPTLSLFVVFALYLLYLFGSHLEHEWGSFRFNVYYFTGVIATVLAALWGGEEASGWFLNLSIFFAFATLAPEVTLLLFFVIPVKVKYIAWVSWAYVLFALLAGSLAVKLLVGASLINYFGFFGRDIARRWRTRSHSYRRQRAFSAKIAPLQGTSIHRCAICGLTEKDDPRMDFRYCRACSGHYEYCAQHLGTHSHMTQPPPEEIRD
ncbi:MAG: rhomboid family intramembrane serine protease [Gammaproteobacteria bacterium]|nr:rhomboid family intramembrane serine protease [Gammaproteobacteria bacterium]